MTEAPKKKNHRCEICGERATCVPAVVIECMSLTIGQRPPIQSIMGVPLCDTHYDKCTPADFLKFDEVRKSIEADFVAARGLPNWSTARMNKIYSWSDTFKEWEGYATKAAQRGSHAPGGRLN